jgi:tRNA U34 5-carboxymethylaminomethyl modifying GTPase MnmE/TrmE
MLEGLGKLVPTDDTIVAIATPPGRSGIGLVRVSGIFRRVLRRRSSVDPHRWFIDRLLWRCAETKAVLFSMK